MSNSPPSSTRSKAIPTVAIVDDDVYGCRFYAEALQRGTGAVVRCFESPAEFIKAVNRGGNFDVIITDLMMSPAGAFSSKAAEGGFLTGVVLAEAIRDAGIGCPIILFTGYPHSARLRVIRERFADDPAFRILCKRDVDLQQLAQSVEKLLQAPDFRSISRRYWEGFIESLQLKPNFMGFGIDLKALLKKP
jgi:CheY-like chemotaxis protein